MAESLYLKGKLSIMPATQPAALTSLLATENGDYTPPAGYDGFNDVTVNVPAIPAQLTGLTVTSNGDYTPPAGYDGFDNVTVQVPQSAAKLIGLTAINNGRFLPPEGFDGFDEVNVNVPTPSGALFQKSMTPGAIANFDDGADMVLPSLVASIVPVQDLHGYDSPWASGAGKNKWDEIFENGTINTNTGAYVTSSDDFRCKNKVDVEGYESIYICCAKSGTLGNFGYVFYDENDTYINGDVASINRTLTVPSNAKYFAFFVPKSWYGQSYGNNIAVNYPSSITTYSPYSNICPISGWTEEVITVTDNLQNPTDTHTTTIPFVDGQGQSVEVFGGSVDVVNGGGTVTRGMRQLTADDIVEVGTSSGGVKYAGTVPIDNVINLDVTAFSNKYIRTNNTSTDKAFRILNNQIFIYDNDITDLSSAKSLLAGTQVCYELATPTTFYTQPTSIKSLDGDNNIWCNSGNILSGSYLSEEV